MNQSTMATATTVTRFTTEKVFQVKFIGRIPCRFHFNPNKSCTKRRCIFSHNPHDAEHFGDLCSRLATSSAVTGGCRGGCGFSHDLFRLSHQLIEEVRLAWQFGLPDGNFVTTMKSARANHRGFGPLEQWLKVNLRLDEDEMSVELRQDSQAAVRFELKPFHIPSDLFDFISVDMVDSVFNLDRDEESAFADPMSIPCSATDGDDGIDRGVWRVRVDRAGRSRRDVGIEFSCVLHPDSPTEPSASHDDTSEFCARFIVKFHLNRRDWHHARDRVIAGTWVASEEPELRGFSTLSQWLDFDALRTEFPLVDQWPRVIGADFVSCLDSWDEFLERSNWRFDMSGHDEPTDNELVPLPFVAAAFAQL